MFKDINDLKDWTPFLKESNKLEFLNKIENKVFTQNTKIGNSRENQSRKHEDLYVRTVASWDSQNVFHHRARLVSTAFLISLPSTPILKAEVVLLHETHP